MRFGVVTVSWCLLAALGVARGESDADSEAAAIKFVAQVKGKVSRGDQAAGKPVIEVDLTDTGTVLDVSRTKIPDAGLAALSIPIGPARNSRRAGLPTRT